jgi:tetratricopeptide (TPR) repeat protein
VPPLVQQLFAQAVEAQKNKRADEAAEKYRAVLRLKPDVMEARLNLAILFAEQKQWDRAVEQFRIARKSAPRNPAIAFELARALLQARKPAQAVEPLRAVTRLDPKSPAPQLLLAQVLSELKRPRPALEAWERLARMDPKNSSVALAAGAMALEGTKEPARAARWLRRAVALAPADPREPLLLGRALLASKQPKEAAQVLRAGFAQFPKATEIGTMLVDARIAAGDVAGATGALRQVIARVPESQGGGVPAGQLRVSLARLLATQKKWAPALVEMDQAARLLPREADVRGLAVDIALRGAQWDAVGRNLDAMIALDAKRLPARLLVARNFAARKRLDAADEQYEKYLRAKPADAQVVAERAVLLEKMGRPDEADKQWKRAQALLPDNPLPGLQRGRALRDAGRDKAALDAFRYVLQNWPGDPNALFEAARLEVKLGQHARAVARWKALIDRKPDFVPAYALLLESARQADQLPSALGFLKQQAARNPEREPLYEAVLNLHARQNRAREGRAWVANLSRLHPRARAPRRALSTFARRFPSLARDEAPGAAGTAKPAADAGSEAKSGAAKEAPSNTDGSDGKSSP